MYIKMGALKLGKRCQYKLGIEVLFSQLTPLLRSYLTNEGLPFLNANKLVIGVSNVIFSTLLKLIVSRLPGFSRRLCSL